MDAREAKNARLQKWRLANPDKVKAINARAYQAHREERLARAIRDGKKNRDRKRQQQSEIVFCSCGARITRGHLARHNATLKHTLHPANN